MDATNMNCKSESAFTPVSGLFSTPSFYFYVKHIVKGQRRVAEVQKQEHERVECVCVSHTWPCACMCVCDYECHSLMRVCECGGEVASPRPAVLIERRCHVPPRLGLWGSSQREGRRAARRPRKRSHPYSSHRTCTRRPLLICLDRGKFCWGGRRWRRREKTAEEETRKEETVVRNVLMSVFTGPHWRPGTLQDWSKRASESFI